MRPAPGRLSPVPDRLEDARRALDEVLGTTEFRDHSRWRDAIDTELPAAVTYTESFFEYADARWERHWTAVHERRKYPLNRVTPRLVLEMSLVVVALALALQWWPPEDVGLIYLLCALAGALWALSALQEWRRMGRDARVMRWEAIESDAWFRRYLRIAVAETASRVINRRAENLAFPVDAPRTDLSIEPLIAWDMDEWDMDLDESVELVDRRIVGAGRSRRHHARGTGTGAHDRTRRDDAGARPVGVVVAPAGGSGAAGDRRGGARARRPCRRRARRGARRTARGRAGRRPGCRRAVRSAAQEPEVDDSEHGTPALGHHELLGRRAVPLHRAFRTAPGPDSCGKARP
jgi:hypothetical protein